MSKVCKPSLIVPHYYQVEQLAACIEFWERGRGNPVVKMDTGAGKSIAIAMLAKYVWETWGVRVLILTHRDELVQGDTDDLLRYWPEAPVSVFSAKQGKRDADGGIVIGMINSVYRHTAKLKRAGKFGLIIVDEAHRVSRAPGSMYRSVIDDLTKDSPDIRIAGYTATDFRQDQGYLTSGRDRVFHSVIYRTDMRRLISEGYLAPMVAGVNSATIKTDELQATSSGEFTSAEVSLASNRSEVNEAACRDVHKALQEGRTSALVFGADVAHCLALHAGMLARGVSAAVVTGDTPQQERQMIYAAFRARRLQCLISCEVLTTGFNAKNVDILAIVRPFGSCVLWIQTLGRGFRVDHGSVKTNCVALDYGNNVLRLGTADAPKVKKKQARQNNGETPKKYCEKCDGENAIAAAVCIECLHPFPEKEEADKPNADDPRGMTLQASKLAIISNGNGETDATYAISSCTFSVQRKRPDDRSPFTTMRVDYYGELAGLATTKFRQVHSEWVCFEHPAKSLPRMSAERLWLGWVQKKNTPFPTTTAEAVRLATRRGTLRVCTRITVRDKPGSKYPQIIDRVYVDAVEQIALFDAPEFDPLDAR